MRLRALALVLTVAAALAACGTPRERHPVGEIPDGPGLLTGEKGGVKITR